MYMPYLYVALETARERAAEADRYRLAAERRRAGDAGRARRFVARAAFALARAADADVLERSASAC
ncbi:MAG TPA: hypothetical protein VFP22_08815 [Candidatus Limnocylindrales bacterium]|nr:hypothetical protein [Candidatus Limnocylindrales bacterium]